MDERIAVVGVGRIGAVTAVGMAHLLHDVTGLDRDADRVAELASGQLREAEPGLRAALRSALRLRRLRFCAVAEAGQFDAAFLCVDTPPAADGSPDLSQLFAAAATAAGLLRPGGLLITRSTVPPGTGARLEAALRTAGRGDIHVVHVPEFLREGRAWEDFREPDRVVIGADSAGAGARAATLFAGIEAPVFVADRVTAELAKYAANVFLATSVSFANEMADLAAALGADAPTLFDILRADHRIGRAAYLTPGLGFGGHCLPKDTAALEYVGLAHGVELRQLRATMEVNRARTWRVVEWLSTALGGLAGRRVALAGLAFKPGTDDLRASPSIALAAGLAGAGAAVTGFDPLVRQAGDIACAPSLEDALRGADALVVAHRAPWVAETDPGWAGMLMRTRVLYDAPGALPAADWAAAGFVTNLGCARAANPARGNGR
ncbi:nucleotide sugar dehydrogenase [Tepidiforma sp.]|uniref:nucleotide sugar dehydrogenase n=1 Tax=Tepidiforma sp. TaxID=2682230 RepID=UPI002ADE75EA|nr:nucleotide sugar dehydrogenase [Tepidiforma sp.]